jgi:glycosyltransferase involved in cell wall biosynthesis
MISIVLTVFNHEDIILNVLNGIYYNCSPLVKELVIVFDGCTDRSQEITGEFIESTEKKFNYNILVSNGVFENKACNLGYRVCREPFILNMQDDMIAVEENFDERLLKPFIRWSEVLAVSAQACFNFYLEDNGMIGWRKSLIERQDAERNIFYIKDAVNRGPLMWRHSMVETLGYFDEIYAPLNTEEVDLCIKGYINHGWLSGLYCLPNFSRWEWGTSHRTNSGNIAQESWVKNIPILTTRYRDFLTGPKHDEERELP